MVHRPSENRQARGGFVMGVAKICGKLDEPRPPGDEFAGLRSDGR